MERMDWRELRREVESELSGVEGAMLLEEWRGATEAVRMASGWGEAFDALERVGINRTAHDSALLWLFGKKETNSAHAAEMALLGIFHPMLMGIHRRKAAWEGDPEVRWGDVLWAFFRAIRRFNPERRRERVAAKIFGDTIHDLYRECRERWISSEREEAHDPSIVGEMADRAVTEHPDDLVDTSPDEDGILQRFRRSGVIDDMEVRLLTFIHVEGLSVKEAAEKAGIGYEAAKKRKQRAETAIRHAAEK